MLHMFILIYSAVVLSEAGDLKPDTDAKAKISASTRERFLGLLSVTLTRMTSFPVDAEFSKLRGKVVWNPADAAVKPRGFVP